MRKECFKSELRKRFQTRGKPRVILCQGKRNHLIGRGWEAQGNIAVEKNKSWIIRLLEKNNPI